MPIFDNQLADKVVSSQWDSYAKKWFHWEFKMYFALVLCYTFAGCMSQTICDAAYLNSTLTGPFASRVGAEAEFQIMYFVNVSSCLLFLRFAYRLVIINLSQ